MCRQAACQPCGATIPLGEWRCGRQHGQLTHRTRHHIGDYPRTRTRTVHMEKTHGNQPARRRGGSDSGVRALRDRPRQQPGGRAGHPVLG
ncbi:hypothetical protein G6F32_017035 [Rhizopus arrhizus]|nr:hypothetical protein G6F32_017035 [Rhizopus arrhizus]